MLTGFSLVGRLLLEFYSKICLTFVAWVISAAWYLRNRVKCAKARNVRRPGCACLSGTQRRVRWRCFLEIKFIFVTKVNILLGICQKLIRSVGSPQALIFIIFGLEGWAYSNDSGTRGSVAFLEVFLPVQSSVRPCPKAPCGRGAARREALLRGTERFPP